MRTNLVGMGFKLVHRPLAQNSMPLHHSSSRHGTITGHGLYSGWQERTKFFKLGLAIQ